MAAKRSKDETFANDPSNIIQFIAQRSFRDIIFG
jgi:hypothetical protein